MKPTPQRPAPQATPMPQKISAPDPAPAPVAEGNDVVRPAPTPDLNPRNRVAAEIAQRANADADLAAAETVPEGDGENEPISAAPTDPAPAPAPAPDATVPDPAPQAAAPASQPAAPAIAGITPDAEYEFVIDGVPTKIKGSQVVSRVQKGEAADYRLNLASRLLEEAKRTVGQPQPPQGAAPAQPAAPQPAALDDAQLAHYIQFGTTEQAAEALKQLRAPRPDAVTKEGLQTLAAQLPRIVETQLSFREGLTFVQKEYDDILKDNDLRQLFFMKENAARQAGDKRTHVQLYKEIGDSIRQRFNPTAPSATPTPAPAAPTIAQKQAAKAAAPAAPRLAAARLEGGSATTKPKTREEIINEMREKRGQHALSVR